jgi:hypothetical protein
VGASEGNDGGVFLNKEAPAALPTLCSSKVLRTTMANISAATKQIREEQQLVGRAKKDLEHREWLRDFVLLSGLIILALAVATLLAR